MNGRDAAQLRKLLSELRQQAVYHLLFRGEGEWKQKKRIDRHGNYVCSTTNLQTIQDVLF